MTVIKYKRIFNIGSSSGGGGISSVVGGTNITIDNTDPDNPIINSSADDITVVANYSALPAVGTVTGDFYWCSASQGTSWLPGSLGGTYYSAGLYYSNGVSWEFMDVPYQATQAEVNTGTNTDKFVTPATLSSWTGRALTVGTTGINSGTTTRILYDNAGVLGEYTLTGTGTVVAMQTSPTFITDITTPKIYGGSAVGSILEIIGTSGNGTSSVGAIAFKVGNNGATTAGTIYNNGQFLYGTTTAPAGALSIPFRLGSGTNTIDIGSYNSSYSAIWFNQGTPSTSNFGFLGNSSTSYLNATSDIYFTIGGSQKATMNTSTFEYNTDVYINAKNLRTDTTTGMKIGTGTTQKIGFWNATPIVQPASANQAAVATTAATNTTPYGFTTQTQADGIITLLNEIRLQLVNTGIIKGAA